MNRIVALPVLAVAAVALSACGSDEDKPSLIGTKYTNELSNALLQKTFPDTSAPPGVWNLEITEYDKVVVDAPDGGGFALVIKKLDDDRVTFEPTGCKTADGKDAGESVYDIERDGDDIRFKRVRDTCADKDPEAQLLSIKTWEAAEAS